MSFGTLHPVLKMPSAAEARAMGEAKWLAFMRRREKIIADEKHDPLQYGYEPPIWRLCDALVEWPWVDKAWAARVRAALGFEKRILVLLIQGGNRAGKSEYAAKRMTQLLNWQEDRIVWPFHESSKMSIEQQQRLFWKFMPPAYRHQVRSETEYIAFKKKTGFSDHRFVLANGSEASFRFYEQDMDRAIQGPSIDGFWCDELVPPDWIPNLEMRVADRDGLGVVTFTPVQGYSPTVRMFQDGAEPALESVAYLAPQDEGEPNLARALGFGDEAEMQAAHAQERWSVPERFAALDDEGWTAPGPRKTVEEDGRAYKTAPRVLRCVNPNYAMVYFHSSDNPFGRPPGVWERIKGSSSFHIMERWYGVAHKTVAARFPKFNPNVHVVEAKHIPAEGTRYHFADPASGRNFFMHWYLVTEEAVYLYREWPSYYEVPGHGAPGAWALPDGKKLDGRPGPAQTPLGFGLLRYKQEIARLEGWPDAERGRVLTEQERRRATAEQGGETRLGLGKQGLTMRERDVRFWTPAGAREEVFERFIDSRAATAARVENDRPRTLQTDFEEIGLSFLLTPGDEISEGVTAINDALDYEEDLPLDFFNKPKLYISSECRNTIYALQTWTGQDGNKGACKDPIDLLRYFFLADCECVAADYWETRGGAWI